MERLVIICDQCGGMGYKNTTICGGIRSGTECKNCKGKGYTDTPQQILDDLECAEIERELLKQACRLDVYLENYSEIEVQISLWFEVNMDKYFSGKTKLEALRKAKEWIEGRGKK